MTRFNSPDRRRFLGGAAALGAAASLTGLSGRAAAQANSSFPLEAMVAEQALPDVWQGSKDAPITMIEYASMTCPHCATFHAQTYPALKSQYIDTGKVRFTLREFPFDPLATAGFMLARCSGPDKREAMISLLFAQQKNWAFSDRPFQNLSSLVRQTGMSQETFESCLKDQTLYDNVNKVRDEGAKKFGVDATPTFFINGRRVSGDTSITELAKHFAPFLKN
jgi:protein-disulfide isomerase